MVSAETEKEPSQVDRLEAEAEAGPGAIAQPTDQSVSSTNTEVEKEVNTGSPSPERGPDGAQEDAKKPEQPEPPARSKAKNVLLLLALCVR